jgi:hypothetical protein
MGTGWGEGGRLEPGISPFPYFLEKFKTERIRKYTRY